MSGGYCRLRVGLYVSVVHRDTDNYLKKSSVTSTLVVNKSALQNFNPMVALYQKISERILYYVGLLNYSQLLTVPYFLSFPRKSCFFNKFNLVSKSLKYNKTISVGYS